MFTVAMIGLATSYVVAETVKTIIVLKSLN